MANQVRSIIKIILFIILALSVFQVFYLSFLPDQPIIRHQSIPKNGVFKYKYQDQVTFGNYVNRIAKVNFKHGLLDGAVYNYNENGTLYSKDFFRKGREIGPQITYYENGIIASEATFQNDGTMSIKRYSSHGALLDEQHGIPNGRQHKLVPVP